MPQIQMLPEQQSPLQQLTPYINQAVGNLTQGYTAGAVNRKDQSILQQLKNATSPMEQWSLVAQLSPEKAKTVAAMSTPYYTAQARAQAKSSPSAKDIMTQEKDTAKFHGQLGAIDYLRERIPYTGSTAIPGTKSFLARGNVGAIVHPSAVTGRAEFQSAVAPVMSFLKDLDTRGNLPQGLFNQLMKRLPDVNETEAENTGRINALEDAIKRYAPDYVKESISKETQQTASKGKISKEIAMEILNSVGGNAEEARKKAKEMGYEF